MRRTAALVVAILLLVTVGATAQKTDVVVLRNGDHFTGTVKQLRRAQVKLLTDTAGTIYIEWDEIVSVTTALVYEVVTQSDVRYVGRLEPGIAEHVQVVAADGTRTSLSMIEVVAFAPIKVGFFERIDGSLDFGGSYTKSSGVGEMSLNLDAGYLRPKYVVSSQLSSNLTRESNASTVSRFVSRSGYTRFREDGWLVSALAFIERNTDLGVDLRSAGGLTAGRHLQRSSRSTTLLAAGLEAGRERLTTGGTLSNLDAIALFSTSFYRYDYPQSHADISLMVFPALNNPGRVRANLDAKLKRELFADFFAAITLYDTFDSRPRVLDASRNDIGATFSIGWSF